MSLARARAGAAPAASVLSLSLSLVLSALSAIAPPRLAAQEGEEGSVRLPLSTWQRLSGARAERGASRDATIGAAEVEVTIEPREGGLSVAVARASASVRVREAHAEVLLLPAGVALRAASADGAPIELAPTSAGLAWIAESAGAHRVELTYEVEARRGEGSASLGLPLPLAASVHVRATLPTEAAGATLVPSVGARTSGSVLDATVAGGGGALLAWRELEALTTPAPSRAVYRGALEGDAVRFEAELDLELARDEPVLVPLFPTDVALSALEVDGDGAPIRTTDDGRFAVLVRGRGRHAIHAAFEVPIATDRGLPGALVRVPEVPVSRFELAVPGDKDVRVEPAVAVRRARRGSTTLATFHVPMTGEVRLEWPEALPAESGAGAGVAGEPELRAAATIVHVVRAEEGLLRATAHVAWELARGSASRFELEVPAGVDVDAVRADAAEVADFRVAGERERVLTVFLDRAVEGTVGLEIDYEVLLGRSAPFAVPLLEARGVRRQRGIAALLATRDLVLEPAGEEGLVRVGENQLPAGVRARIDATVAHVFRWSDAAPDLRATTASRPREAARFDASVDTLVSLGDASTTAWAAIDLRVKSGSLSELAIALPEGANLLDVIAPSLREHRIETGEGGRPRVRLSFTQDMEGDLRVELRWERIVAAGEDALAAPMAHVVGADVEQGRVAIEATAAVEIEPAAVEGLSPIEVGELPEELVVRSESPVLLAYRWAHAEPAPRLLLDVARHRRAELREAAIDEAIYRTLVTDDGLAVTVATWMVRNERQQFLRVALPEGSEVWSARVGGRAETPAIASEEGAPVILIGVVRAPDAFPVEVVYATPIARLGALGRLGLELARPDAIAARTRWEVLLPEGARWGTPSSALALRERGSAEGRGLVLDGTIEGMRAVEVPATGEIVVLEGLFAEREGRTVALSVPYASGLGVALGWALGLLGALLAWIGLLGVVMSRAGVALVPERSEGGGPVELATYRVAASARTVATTRRGLALLVGTGVGGAALLAVALGWLEISAWGPAGMSALFVLGLALALRRHIGAWLRTIRARFAPPPAAPTAAPPTAAPPGT